MVARVKDGTEMVRQMSPRLLPGRYVFRTVETSAEAQRLLPEALGMFRENEGMSLILPASAEDGDVYRQITLDVHSALDGVGLTAAVSRELADRDIPSNVVAANHHDHVLVPEALAEAAFDALIRLSRGEDTAEPEE